MKLLVCTMKRSPPMSSCGSRGGEHVYDILKSKCSEYELDIEVAQIKCLGYCEDGPNVSAVGTGKMWSKVNDKNADEVIEFCKDLVKK